MSEPTLTPERRDELFEHMKRRGDEMPDDIRDNLSDDELLAYARATYAEFGLSMEKVAAQFSEAFKPMAAALRRFLDRNQELIEMVRMFKELDQDKANRNE